MRDVFKKEFCRKIIQMAGVLFLPLLFKDRFLFSLAFALLLLTYFFIEKVSPRFFDFCKREKERHRLSQGALLLLFSAIVCPYLFGMKAAAVGLAQVFAADSPTTLIGMKFGTKRIPYTKNKTWMGSVTFFFTATCVSFIFVSFPQTILLGLMGTVVEAFSPPEWDNLTIPVLIGWITTLFLTQA